MSKPFLLSLVSMLAVLAVTRPSHAIGEEDRPELLPAQKGCQRWLGSASGNDPSVRLQLRLCEVGGTVSGQTQWSSLQSGWNLRGIEGGWSSDGGTLILRDVEILEEKPEPGWRFCEIDTYRLTREGNRLTGTYDSAACTDHATMTLTLQTDDDGVPPAPSPTLPPPSTPPPELGNDVCGCQAAAPSGRGFAPAGLLMLGLALLGATRHRR